MLRLVRPNLATHTRNPPHPLNTPLRRLTDFMVDAKTRIVQLRMVLNPGSWAEQADRTREIQYLELRVELAGRVAKRLIMSGL